MPIYMNLDVSLYPGSATALNYEKWHIVQSYDWGLFKPANTPPTFNPFSVTLAPIRSATKLMLLAATGKLLPKVIVAVVDGNGQEQQRYTFSNVVFQSFQQYFNDGETGPPMDFMSFGFSKISYKQWIEASQSYETSIFDLATGSTG